MQSNTKKRVGILRGGAGEHYASSIQKGGNLISYIFENLSDKYKPVDILVDKDYIWHFNGVPINPGDLFHKVDVVWNLSHPSFSNILDSLSIPNVGNGAFSGALQNSRIMLREHMRKISLPMPRNIVFPKSAREVFEKFGAPWIVKIYNDVKLVKTFNKLAEMINGKDNVIVEEFIAGKVASVHSMPKFRDQDIYTFPLGNSFGNFSSEEKETLATLAKDLYRHIGAKHYLKSDFVMNPRGRVYLLQIEMHPDLNPDSHFSQVTESVGVKMQDVIEHILKQTMK